jgi:hypothetical protein
VTDSNIHIYHGTGLEQSLTEYCKPSNTVPFVKGDRVIIKIDLGYSTMSNLIPIPPLTLHTESAHTILMGAEVVAVDPPAIPGTGYQCDLTPYTISVDDPRAMSITVTIGQSHSGYATAITNIIVVWDKTGGPILKSIENPCSCSGVTTINSTGPFYQSGVNWTFVPGSTKKFKINFDKKLKSDVIIQLTLNDEHHCTIGK